MSEPFVSTIQPCEEIGLSHDTVNKLRADGVDHPSNGIPLCPTHHSAFDRYLFAFDSADQSVVFKDGLNASMLGITKAKLAANVSAEALKMRYELFLENNCG